MSIQNIFFLFFLLISNSCKRNTINKVQTNQKNKDPNLDFTTLVETKQEKNIQEKILNRAISIAKDSISKINFEIAYIDFKKDSLFETEVKIISKISFFKDLPLLIIKRKSKKNTYINVFLNIDKQPVNILTHNQSNKNYITDTIYDVNGDGNKDFLISSQISKGDFPRTLSSVYLFNPKSNRFSKRYDFSNPTFYPEEKTIRGLCNGLIGDTEMYKFKWNKKSIDTIEYVYFEKNGIGDKTGNIIISNYRRSNENKIEKILNFVPKEYVTIEGYKWFVGEVLP